MLTKKEKPNLLEANHSTSFLEHWCGEVKINKLLESGKLVASANIKFILFAINKDVRYLVSSRYGQYIGSRLLN